MAKKIVAVSAFVASMSANLSTGKYFPTCSKPSSLLSSEMKKALNAKYDEDVNQCMTLFIQDVLTESGINDIEDDSKRTLARSFVCALIDVLPSNLEKKIELLDQVLAAVEYS